MAKKKQSSRSAKDPDLLRKIREAVESGNYLESKHALERAIERNIIAPEYEYVLKTGNHESNKDEFDQIYNTWNYAIRGKTINGRELRIIVTFDEDDLLLITVIDLEA